MVIGISDKSIKENIGNKAKFLMEMKKSGFEVPDGFILASDTFNEIVSYNKVEKKISEIISNISITNIKESSEDISSLFDNFMIPKNISSELEKRLKKTKKYAVRSSGIKEDLENHSFAGQYDTFLNLNSLNEIEKAIINCYRSMYSEVILSYFINNNLSLENLSMAVIIQEMVDSDKSGIVFTVNPLTGTDTEMVIEIARGLGENIVSGKVVPESYRYNLFDNKCIYPTTNKLLNKKELNMLVETSYNIMIHFGYPVDIEFAIKDSKLYILQARAITKIMYSKIKDQWSTADFKDGGVSATVCTPYMWSLYEYIWETTLKRFVVESKMLKKSEVRKLGDMFYGRPYWNLTMVKKAMANVPGYKEREFDQEFGVKITYDGDGITTKASPKVLFKLLNIALCQMKIVKEQNNTIPIFKEEYLNKYYDYLEKQTVSYNKVEIEKLWYHLVKNDYLKSEGTYFWQIFINTVHQALFKDKLLKYVSESEYFNLISGLNNISHLLPFYDIWDITRKIRQDKDSIKFWNDSSIKEIKNLYLKNSNKYFLKDVYEHINKYGYHSEKELDVTYPCYFEDIDKVIKMFKETLILEDNCSPIMDKEKQAKKYKDQLDKIKNKVGSNKFNKIYKKIEQMRSMLWWREELRDVSTRFYYIIRIFTIKLAEVYKENGIIKEIDDIWYLKIDDIFKFINQKINAKELQTILTRNKKYYLSFRNFMSENEIGSVFDKNAILENSDKNIISGIGCNNGTVIGTARIIENLDEIDKLQVDDILITKFTDTGWTSKFAILKGIVTEYGGILCHAAIISREYGIPCIVCCQDATKKIKNGSTISINGANGAIKIIKE